MSDPKRTAVEELDSLVDAYLKDLVEAPDEVFEDDIGHAVAESSTFRELVAAATVEAGKRRLLRARRELENSVRAVESDQRVDLADARRYLAEAANDNRITLAARELNEVPDDEIIRIYLQLQQLEAQNRKGKSHGDA